MLRPFLYYAQSGAYTMKISIIAIGRTANAQFRAAIDDYMSRLRRYATVEFTALADVKGSRSMSHEQQKQAEGSRLLAGIETGDHVVLLDERGDEYRSVEFAARLQRRMASGCKRLVFVIGGPYGFSPDVYARANSQLSLSRMTLSHEMIRLLFVEQLYRAFSILNNEPYHHE